MGEETIELYADMDKTLSVVDGDNKQLLMSQGTFIESYKKGAAFYGYSVEVIYSTPNFTDKMPLIATIKVHKEENVDTGDAISSSTYAAINSDATCLNKTLNQCITEFSGVSYTVIESSLEVEKLKKELLAGTIIESRDEAATRELLDIFRFTEWEKNEHRYGLSLKSLPGILKPFIQPLIKFSSKSWEGFGNSSIKQFEGRLAVQTRYILIKYEDPKKINYVQVGQLYQKLINQLVEYNLRPAMQVLENFEAMKSLNALFQQEHGIDGVVVMILGMQDAAKSARNPRHLVEDILTNQH